MHRAPFGTHHSVPVLSVRLKAARFVWARRAGQSADSSASPLENSKQNGVPHAREARIYRYGCPETHGVVAVTAGSGYGHFCDRGGRCGKANG